jgi:hypothetical protein
LGEGEEVVWKESIKDNLALSKRTGEKKFDVRWLEDQPALKKPFEEGAAEHQNCTADQAFGSDQLGKSLGAAIVEENSD